MFDSNSAFYRDDQVYANKFILLFLLFTNFIIKT